MKDRTAFILSGIFHAVLLLYFSISLSAHYKIPRMTPETFVKVKLDEQPPVPTPKPEPTQPKPKPTVRKKPDVSKNLIKKLQNKLKTPTKRRRRTPTPKPTRKPTQKPRPTATPKAKTTPTHVPTPTFQKIPLKDMKNLPTPRIKSVTEPIFIQGDPNTNFNFDNYGAILVRQLLRAWKQPTVLRPERKDYVTEVTFQVARDGKVSNIKIINKSGWPILDLSVLQAIRKANPVEPLPFSYSGNSIDVTIQFVKPLE